MPVLERTSVSPFDALETYSHAEVQLLNWSLRALPKYTAWESWFQEGLAPLLEVPRGSIVQLEQNNEFQGNETKTYRSERKEITIGRDSACDLVLELRVVSKKHARLFQQNGEYYLEDAGSAAGTYLNKRKLVPHSPELLSDGDEFDIVPYSFIFATEQVWAAEDQFEFWKAPIDVASWSQFDATSPPGSARLQIAVHPGSGSAVLEADRTFLSTIVRRLTRTDAPHLVDSDLGALEFLFTSVLAKASQDLKFPLQFSLERLGHHPGKEDLGLVVQFSVGLSGVRSALRIFIPREVLDRFPQTALNIASSESAKEISWQILVAAGYAELSLSDFRELETGDIVLFASEIAVLLPRLASKSHAESGWFARHLGDNPYRIEIIEFFERKLTMEEVTPRQPDEAATNSDGFNTPKPSFEDLPVRLHVILSQTELSLADLNGLIAGSIIELDRGKNDSVHLAVNGKVIGSGELIEIEGKLGVRIVQWSAS